MSEDPDSISGLLADFVARTGHAELPDEVRSKARLHAVDALGIALASSTMDFGASVHDGALALEGAAPPDDGATILGFGHRMTPARAALVNGTLMHGLDFDDTHVTGVYHATAPALAAGLAVGESVDASVSEVLAAYAIGLEVGCRLALAAPGKFHDVGFHPTGICGTFAACCVAAKLQGTSVEVLRSALGLCGSMAAGILEIGGSWLKRLHPGWAASSGISALALATAGFRGPEAVFEGSKGLYQAHVGTRPTADHPAFADLGAHWDLLDIALKPYPCCHFIHAFIDAALELRAELGGCLDEIQRIECAVSAQLIPLVVDPIEQRRAPATIYDALFSIPFVTAVALHDGEVPLRRFYQDDLQDPAVLALAQKVTCVVDQRSDYPRSFPGEVTIVLRDGTTRTVRSDHSRGTVSNPLSTDQIVAKFEDNAAIALGQADAEALGAWWLAAGPEPIRDVCARASRRPAMTGPMP